MSYFDDMEDAAVARDTRRRQWPGTVHWSVENGRAACGSTTQESRSPRPPKVTCGCCKTMLNTRYPVVLVLIPVEPIGTKKTFAFVNYGEGDPRSGGQLVDMDVMPDHPKGQELAERRIEWGLGLREASKVLGLKAVELSALEHGRATFATDTEWVQVYDKIIYYAQMNGKTFTPRAVLKAQAKKNAAALDALVLNATDDPTE